MSLEKVLPMSLEYFVTYVPERFTCSDDIYLSEILSSDEAAFSREG